jgi:hypothetical protein
VSNPEILLKNIKEVADENSIIYISTPNDLKKTDRNKWHKVHFDFYSLFNIIQKIFGDVKITMFGADQWGFSNDFAKPYIVAKIEL